MVRNYVISHTGKTLCYFALVWLLCSSALPNWAQVVSNGEKEPGASRPQSSVGNALASARAAFLDRHYAEAIGILRTALRNNPDNQALQLELGRGYLATGRDSRAERLFRGILEKDPANRAARLELARTLSCRRRYRESDELYRALLTQDHTDEAAAIGLTNNLMHEGRSAEASAAATAALAHHPNSLRLLEFRDRIANGLFGGDERALPVAANLFSSATDYVNDSSGNHSWRGTERLELKINPSLTSETHLEQGFLHSLDDPLEVEETFSEVLRWRPAERIAVAAGGGAIRFDDADLRAIYEGSITVQVARHLLAGAGFSRVPIVPDAEASEHELTAQGWEAFGVWTPEHWQVNIRASRRHYTDTNVGAQELAEALHQWTTAKMNYVAGYRLRYYGFSHDFAHGYFSPAAYQSHQATFGLMFHPGGRYRGELTARAGAESLGNGADFQPAWEINARNEVILGKWTLNLDYSRYHLAQVTGAFRADAARFGLAYHF